MDMNMEMKRVLMILPAYNEEKNIEKTVASIVDYARQQTAYSLDYIVINDGSTDGTAALCQEKGIRCIHLIQNLGIGGAVQTGYLYARLQGYDVAVQFDGDGQHDIQSLTALITPLLEDKADFTVGSRFVENSSSFRSTALRRVGIRYLSGLLSLLSSKKIHDPTSGFRGANRQVIALLSAEYPVDYPEPESLVFLAKSSCRIQEVPVNMFEREGGVSSISALKSIYYMLKVTLAMLCASFQRRKRGL